jgi:hypothetical protein
MTESDSRCLSQVTSDKELGCFIASVSGFRADVSEEVSDKMKILFTNLTGEIWFEETFTECQSTQLADLKIFKEKCLASDTSERCRAVRVF